MNFHFVYVNVNMLEHDKEKHIYGRKEIKSKGKAVITLALVFVIQLFKSW